jgi:hypothetical protein
MTQAEQMLLEMRGLLGEALLSCQILWEFCTLPTNALTLTMVAVK